MLWNSPRLVITLLTLITSVGAAHAQSPLTCLTTAPPLLLRAESLAELGGDYLIVCFGGTPTPEGQPLPTTNIQIILNTHISSRLLKDGWSEALLLIDEPLPFMQRVCGSPGDMITGLGTCGINGTSPGGWAYDGSPGRPNIFQGQQAGVDSITWTRVPFDPPGNGVRVMRIVNVRTNVASITGPPGPQPLSLNATVSSTGQMPLPISTNSQVLGVVLPGLTWSVDQPAQCAPVANKLAGTLSKRVLQTTVHIRELVTNAYRSRTFSDFIDNDTSPPPSNQNLPNTAYDTETGFFNSGFPVLPGRGNLARAGLADSGTRVFVRISNVPPGISLYSPIVIPLSGSFFPGVARRVDTDANGAGAFRPTAGDAAGLARIPNVGRTVMAAFEVLLTDSVSLEEIQIPIYAAIGNDGAAGPLGKATLVTGFAPFASEEDPNQTGSVQEEGDNVSPAKWLPRFAAPSAPAVPFTTHTCHP